MRKRRHEIDSIRSAGSPRWRRGLTLAAHAVWAIPVVFAIRILRPVCRIRLGTLNYTRIGHFVADGAEQVGGQLVSNGREVRLFWLGDTCNEAWARFLSRYLRIYSWVRFVDRWNRLIPGGQPHQFASSETGSRDIRGMMSKVTNHLSFSDSENQMALSWMNRTGWQVGEPIVTLLVRDDAYLGSREYHVKQRREGVNPWAYHSYRNADIETYRSAVEWLLDQGVWVFRMGQEMRRPLNIAHPRFVDYAFLDNKSEFMDIWLFANCKATISTGSGPDQLAHVFARPLLFTNFIPLGHYWSFANVTVLPKTLRWKNSGRDLSVLEHLEEAHSTSNGYESAGIDVIDNTSDQILQAVQRFWLHKVEKGDSPADEPEIQDRFWKLLETSKCFRRYHEWRHPQSEIEAGWLIKRSWN